MENVQLHLEAKIEIYFEKKHNFGITYIQKSTTVIL